jgi:metal-dependent amidase/aminoacylase/carboxypeptidase family protein
MIDREQMDRSVDAVAPQVITLSKQIHANPELRFEEHRAAGWLADSLEQAGIAVERGVGDLPTAFRARLGAGGGPRIAILAEYDALPEIGHACGHNLIAGGALGAFLALAKQGKLPGNVDLIGTPAEEGGGGKIRLLQAGVFEGVDAAMMFHPYDRDILAHPALAEAAVHAPAERDAPRPLAVDVDLLGIREGGRIVIGGHVHEQCPVALADRHVAELGVVGDHAGVRRCR